MAYPDDTVTLEIGDNKFAGWQDVKIVRGVEVFPSHFMLRVTERLPGQPKMFPIDPGVKCRVKIGSDTVITGFVDVYDAQISPRGHQVTVLGRSSTEDLIDCAAGVSQGKEPQARMTFMVSSLLQLAKDLCAPFGITVTAPDGEGEPLVTLGDGSFQMTIPLGASVYDKLEPVARWRQRLLLDGNDGNLIIATVGKKKHASGFDLPGSVKQATVRFDKQNRYTVYLPARNSVDLAYDVSAAQGTQSANYFAPIPDAVAFKGQPRWDGQLRYRPKFVVSEQALLGINLAEQRAKWQKARDYGRSQAVNVVVALWRDSAGTLWTPNMLASINIPALKLSDRTWLISQVTYMKGFGGGTQTMVSLMPPEAFSPEPSFYRAFDPEVAAAQQAALQTRPPQGPGI
jgi:prophage tail gpP-like protein